MTDAASPTARALVALEAIQSAPGITGARLAGRLGVTERAARRYVAILRDAGIPVDSVSGLHGGYRIGRGARIPPLIFTRAEALALLMSVLQGWHGSVDPAADLVPGDEAQHPAVGALAKIFRVLPASTAGPVEAIRRIRAQNPGDASSIPDPELTLAAAHAAEAGERILLEYRTGTVFDLDPWAVVVRHGRWYVLAVVHGTDRRRVLRLDRVVRIETTGRAAPRPSDLDAIEEVEHHLVDGWSHEVRVEIAAPVGAVAPYLPRALGRLEPDGDGRSVIHGSTDVPDWYATQLAAIPAPFTVSGSAEVCAAVDLLAQRLAASTRAGVSGRGA